jgi:LemA protein
MTLPEYLLLTASALFLVWTAVVYNRFVRSAERTKEAWSGIEVQLTRRANLIPNLVETVRGYATHERATLTEVVRARKLLEEARGAAQSGEANDRLSESVERLLAVAEAYPELQASRNFRELQGELADAEEKIAFARQFYNRNVATFNARVRSVPDLLVALAFRFRPFEFFGAVEGEREVVRVDLTPS